PRARAHSRGERALRRGPCDRARNAGRADERRRRPGGGRAGRADAQEEALRAREGQGRAAEVALGAACDQDTGCRTRRGGSREDRRPYAAPARAGGGRLVAEANAPAYDDFVRRLAAAIRGASLY